MELAMALLIIDVQNDFCPGGALPVADGDQVVAPLNRAIELFAAHSLPIFASRDWHPADSTHFQQQGGPWPAHCVQGSAGAAFHRELRLPETAIILSKGVEPQADGYSVFEGISWNGQPFAELLAGFGVEHLVVGGLATDYCVRATVLDALQRGLAVTVLIDGVAGVNLRPGDSQRALEEMEEAGARKLLTNELSL